MREYFTDAIVLDKEPLGELDSRVSLYTRDLGRVRVKVRSARRITSKLAPHLEPLSHVQIRLIEKNNLQVADVLQYGKLPVEQLKVLQIINRIMPMHEPDDAIWHSLKSGNSSAKTILRLLGFDTAFATCALCESNNPTHFYIPDSNYLCSRCLPRPLHSQECFSLSEIQTV